MKSQFILIFSLLLVSTFCKAAEQNLVCDNLHKLTCAPGSYDDGTGSAKNATLSDNEQKKIQDEIISNAKEKFQSVVSNPQNAYFRKTILSASGLSLNPICEGAAKNPNKECTELLLTSLGEMMVKKMFNPFLEVNMLRRNENGNFPDQVYVLDSRQFKEVSEQILVEMKKRIGLDELDKKVKEKIFPEVKEILLSKVKLMVGNPETRQKLVEKINEIEYDGSNCSENKEQEEGVAALLIPNAYYHPTKRIFKYCSGLNLQNKSDFQIAYVIAHELSHSIDPCGISNGPSDFTLKYPENVQKQEAEKVFPFSGLITCLRGETSVGAMDQQAFNIKYPPPNSPPPNSPSQPTSNYFCNQDQITETFSDWMGSEILPDYIEKNYPKLTQNQFRLGFSNVWRGMCNQSSEPAGFDVHPEQIKRVNHLLLMQPKIRKQMGCPETISGRVYCTSTLPYQDQLRNQPSDSQVQGKSAQ